MGDAYLDKHMVRVYLQDLVSIVLSKAADPAFSPVDFAAAYFSAGSLL
jgi:hypothetical protein